MARSMRLFAIAVVAALAASIEGWLPSPRFAAVGRRVGRFGSDTRTPHQYSRVSMVPMSAADATPSMLLTELLMILP